MNQACETCGKPATVHLADIKEDDPVPDDNGRLRARWAIINRHSFCDQHARKPAVQYRPESVAVGLPGAIAVAMYEAEALAKALRGSRGP